VYEKTPLHPRGWWGLLDVYGGDARQAASTALSAAVWQVVNRRIRHRSSVGFPIPRYDAQTCTWATAEDISLGLSFCGRQVAVWCGRPYAGSPTSTGVGEIFTPGYGTVQSQLPQCRIGEPPTASQLVIIDIDCSFNSMLKPPFS
jgi:hypothetical protein